MYKNTFFVLLIALAGIGTVFAFRKTSQSPVQATRIASETAVVSGTNTNFYKEKNGIDVSIEQIQERDGLTVLTLALNNHRYDLGRDSIYENATLNGQSSNSHKFLSNTMGGHHVRVEVVFDKTTSGQFVLSPAEGITFTFDNIW